ncbi:MAG: 5'-nucleotidase [Bacteroidia bacterium]|nr:5'-nucleotidase [Bacteroidia bacterium]
MKRIGKRLIYCMALAGVMSFVSCRSAHETSRYEIKSVQGSMINIDSVFDSTPDLEAERLLAPYKAQIDKTMYEVIGTSALMMDKGAPESLLSNLVAEVLRLSADQVLGHPADMGLVNMGGLRNILPKGPITVGTVFEILPFENSLCVLTLKGQDLKRLFQAIASCRGEGISGPRMTITKDGALLEVTLDGKEIQDDRLYTVATIDYLADGNGRMDALLQAVKRECPDNGVLRDLFLNYVRRQTAEGKIISSQIDGRVTVK